MATEAQLNQVVISVFRSTEGRKILHDSAYNAIREFISSGDGQARERQNSTIAINAAADVITADVLAGIRQALQSPDILAALRAATQ